MSDTCKDRHKRAADHLHVNCLSQGNHFLFFHFFFHHRISPVFTGRDPAYALEGLHEMLFIIISDPPANVLKPLIRLGQQPLCLCNTDVFQVIHEICASIFFKCKRKEGIIHGHIIGNKRHVQVFLIVFPYVSLCLADLCLILILTELLFENLPCFLSPIIPRSSCA